MSEPSSVLQIRGLTRRFGGLTAVDHFDVDVNDEDGCFELLRRMAKQNGLKPTDCEIDVKTGRTKKTYRM